MYKLVDLIEKNKEEISLLDSLDNGKTFKDAMEVDMNEVIGVLRYYAGWADKIHGNTIPINSPHLLYTRKEPVGVCG